MQRFCQRPPVSRLGFGWLVGMLGAKLVGGEAAAVGGGRHQALGSSSPHKRADIIASLRRSSRPTLRRRRHQRTSRRAHPPNDAVLCRQCTRSRPLLAAWAQSQVAGTSVLRRLRRPRLSATCSAPNPGRTRSSPHRPAAATAERTNPQGNTPLVRRGRRSGRDHHPAPRRACPGSRGAPGNQRDCPVPPSPHSRGQRGSGARCGRRVSGNRRASGGPLHLPGVLSGRVDFDRTCRSDQQRRRVGGCVRSCPTT
jgi:hypothetical protein